MNNRLFLSITALLLSAFFISCTSTNHGIPVTTYSTTIDFSAENSQFVMNTLPISGNPRFFAAVQRKSNRDDELSAALLKASEQASKFIAVKATSKFYLEKINSSMKYMRDLEVLWDRDLALEMIDRLEILHIFQDRYGTYIIAELPDRQLNKVPFAPTTTNGVPDWTNRIPEIPGYIVSVGIALQSSYIADSFNAADDQALEDLSRQISVQIVTGKKQIENSVGSASLQTNYELSEVVIPGFYILDRWRSPDSRYYYSLAIAPIIE